MIYLGMHERWLGHITELRMIAKTSPLAPTLLGDVAGGVASSSSSSAPKTAPTAPSASTAIAIVGPEPVAMDTVGNSDQQVNLVNKSKHLMAIACRVLANRTTYMLMVGMHALASPIEQAHNYTVVALKAQMGTWNWLVGMCTREYEKYVSGVLRVACSEEFFVSIGFDLDLESA